MFLQPNMGLQLCTHKGYLKTKSFLTQGYLENQNPTLDV
jgi:hypothetical protein